MEKSVFPRPAVAGELSKHFVESRLHGDGKIQAEVRKLQMELVGALIYPTYVIVDPKTGRKLGTKVLENIESTDATAEDFVRWLEKSRQSL